MGERGICDHYLRHHEFVRLNKTLQQRHRSAGFCQKSLIPQRKAGEFSVNRMFMLKLGVIVTSNGR